MKSAIRPHINPIGRDLFIITLGTFILTVILVTLAVMALHQL
jgi:hypothetical protein